MSEITVGGQAVLEGVMMRAPGVMSVAVRRRDGSIVLKKQALKSPADTYPILKLPVIRGLLVLVQSMTLGFKALDFSSAVAMKDVDEDHSESSYPEKTYEDNNNQGLSLWAILAVLGSAFTIGIGFFFFIPLIMTELLSESFLFVKQNALAYNLTDGMIRIVFLILYIFLISLMPDIRRVFQYHGAEHKAIYTYESNLELTSENAIKFSTLHPRCGTAFLLTVMCVSILVFSMVPSSTPFWIKLISRVIFLPLIAGLSFEIIKKSGESSNGFIRILTVPGLWLQRITTQEPDLEQIEVGLIALKAALEDSDINQYDVII